ncbi:hypothetical protein Bca4012_091774 [Brassica carinata]
MARIAKISISTVDRILSCLVSSSLISGHLQSSFLWDKQKMKNIRRRREERRGEVGALDTFVFQKLMYQHESGLFDFRRTESSPLLLVIDKRDDPAMVHELIGLEDNKVDVRAIGSLSKDQQVQEQVAKSNKNIQTVEDMARFVDSYPEHKKMQGNVSKHVTLVTEMSKLVEARKLMLVSQTEQDLACNGGSWN